MRKMLSFALAVILGAATSLVPDRTDAGGQKKDAPLPERVQRVRQMYEKIPPVILELVDPVEVVKCTMYEDGGTIGVHLKDAKSKSAMMVLDGKINSPTRWTMFLTPEPRVRRPVLLRGPEEAALYGILLRWKAGKDTEFWTGESVRALLGHIDARFAADVPAK